MLERIKNTPQVTLTEYDTNSNFEEENYLWNIEKSMSNEKVFDKETIEYLSTANEKSLIDSNVRYTEINSLNKKTELKNFVDIKVQYSELKPCDFNLFNEHAEIIKENIEQIETNK